MDNENDSGPNTSLAATRGGGAQRRLGRLFDLDEAQIVLDDLPPDLSEESPDSDPEDPDYEDEPEVIR